jgi:serine/threonine-protein kinase
LQFRNSSSLGYTLFDVSAKPILQDRKLLIESEFVQQETLKVEGGDNFGEIEDSLPTIQINSNLILAYLRQGYAYNKRGYVRLALGEQQGAIEDFNQAIRLSPNYSVAYNNRGYALLRLKDQPQAIEYHTATLRINLNSADTDFLGNDGQLGREVYQEAIEDFNQAIKLTPHLAAAYANRGYAYIRLGDKFHAIKD